MTSVKAAAEADASRAKAAHDAAAVQLEASQSENKALSEQVCCVYQHKGYNQAVHASTHAYPFSNVTQSELK